MKKDNKDTKQKIIEDEDFIYCPRLGNSLNKLIEKNPEGVEDDRIARVLLISEKEVKDIFTRAVSKIRNKMGL